MFWILLLAVSIKHIRFFRNIPALPLSSLIIFFLIKVMAGSVYIFVYTYYFDPQTADVHRFFNEGMIIYRSLFDNPLDYLRILTGIDASEPHLQVYYQRLHYWFFPERPPLLNDNRLIIGFNAIANILSFGSIHINSAFANFISFSGLVALYKFGLKHIKNENISWLKLGVFLFPSALFWGSGLTKEVFILPLLGFFLFYFDKALNGSSLSIRQIFLFSSTIFLLLWLKVYVFLLLIPCLIAYFISGKLKRLRPELLFLVISYLVLAVMMMVSLIFLNIDPLAQLAERQNFFMKFSVMVDAGSLIHEVYLEPTFQSILAYTPHALLNVLIRPHLFDSTNPLILKAAIENIFIVGMLAAMAYFGVKNQGFNRIQCLGILFTLLLFIFIGLTTQVYGTLVRLKIPALPLLWISFLSISPYIGKNSVRFSLFSLIPSKRFKK
ncbi:MAG TPA: hypothetical protein VLH61_05850 [Bacteroidales bacterium]|nr:hypothetical protein [Bacteroidales bacterium]